jgi:hypothetical protein
MNSVFADFSDISGKIKPMNAVNNGPKRKKQDQQSDNIDAYASLRIPYARLHDSAHCHDYGGPYTVDITGIFQNFDADENDPASYDFVNTDEYLQRIVNAGTKIFYRLGQSIEHTVKKHGTLPPRDFSKWARICEHIIMHVNEGWADGTHLGVEYWEIWNEPDLDDDASPNKRCWGGTKAQFFDFYEIAAKHLKGRFPSLKIGGPASCGRLDWSEDFLSEMEKRSVPLDFFSWHIYAHYPEKMPRAAAKFREMLDRHGYAGTESILNEWNYVRGWTEDFVYSLKAIHGIKGAAFTASVICLAQDCPVDMLMYYDTRPSAFNGAFDFYTYGKLKGYWPLYWYGRFYDAEHEIKAVSCPPNVYALCGEDAGGKLMMMVSHYNEDDGAEGAVVHVDPGKTGGRYEIFAADSTHDGECTGTGEDIVLRMERNSIFFIREV